MFGRSKNSYGHFCCVPGCPNQRGKDKISGIQRSYYRFPSDQKQTRLWVKLIRRDKWEPKKHDRICSDHFEGGMHCFILYLHVVNPSISGISRLEALISFYLCLFLESVSLSHVQKNEHPGLILFSSITVLALVYKGYTPAYIYMFVCVCLWPISSKFQLQKCAFIEDHWHMGNGSLWTILHSLVWLLSLHHIHHFHSLINQPPFLRKHFSECPCRMYKVVKCTQCSPRSSLSTHIIHVDHVLKFVCLPLPLWPISSYMS